MSDDRLMMFGYSLELSAIFSTKKFKIKKSASFLI